MPDGYQFLNTHRHRPRVSTHIVHTKRHLAGSVPGTSNRSPARLVAGYLAQLARNVRTSGANAIGGPRIAPCTAHDQARSAEAVP
jgi:hypothetical protein